MCTYVLRLRLIDVLTAQEDGAAELDDDLLLQRATALGRVLVSQDEDLLREAARRLSDHKNFSGLIYSHQLRITNRPGDLSGRVVRKNRILANLMTFSS